MTFKFSKLLLTFIILDFAITSISFEQGDRGERCIIHLYRNISFDGVGIYFLVYYVKDF
jgi:hypothetical protein